MSFYYCTNCFFSLLFRVVLYIIQRVCGLLSIILYLQPVKYLQGICKLGSMVDTFGTHPHPHTHTHMHTHIHVHSLLKHCYASTTCVQSVMCVLLSTELIIYHSTQWLLSFWITLLSYISRNKLIWRKMAETFLCLEYCVNKWDILTSIWMNVIHFS